MSDYVYQPFPSWRYHASETALIVANEEEDKALGSGWCTSPALVNVKAEKKPSKTEMATPETEIPTVKTEMVPAKTEEKPAKKVK